MRVINKKKVAWLFIAPSLLGVAGFFLVPFLISIYFTFTQGISNVTFVGIDNFIELFNNPAFVLSMKNTGVFLLVGVPLLTLTSLALSLMMSDKLYRFPRWAMLSPMIVPVASAMMSWQVIFADQGVINSLLARLSINSINFWGEQHAMKIMIFIFVIKNAGYMMIIFTSAISALGMEYKEAFMLDTQSEFQYARRIVIPLIKPIIFFVSMLSVINSFQMFRDVYAVYGDYPPKTVYLLQYFMNNNFYKLNYQRLSTAAFLLIVVISLVVLVYLRYQDRKRI